MLGSVQIRPELRVPACALRMQAWPARGYPATKLRSESWPSEKIR